MVGFRGALLFGHSVLVNAWLDFNCSGYRLLVYLCGAFSKIYCPSMTSYTEVEIVTDSSCVCTQTDGDFYIVEPASTYSFGAISFPPATTTTGKRYYVCAPRHRVGPRVVCGWQNTLQILGSFHSGGTAPKGFASLESAVAECAAVWDSYKSVIVQISP